MLPEWIRSYLYFHRKERNGLIVLLVFMGVVIGYNVHLRSGTADRQHAELIHFGPSIERFIERTALLDSVDQYGRDDARALSPFKGERFAFDPNTLDSAGWTRLGFSSKQAAAVIKYRSKGGTFRKPEDLLRLYWMDTARFNYLLPFISMAEVAPRKADTLFHRKYVPTPLVIVDINLADTTALTDLKGIGPAFARNIVRYREKLGGFRNLEQLLEVYGMDSARYNGLIGQVTLGTSDLKRIDINKADFKELIKNPYINKNQVNAVLKYREQHGSFKSVSDLQKIHLFTSESYHKLEPYLMVQ